MMGLIFHNILNEEGNTSFSTNNYMAQVQLHADGVTVSCVSQEGRIARLDIMGTKASQLMSKILRPVTM